MTSKVNASHILVKTETEAWAILNSIKNGKSFEELAREKSLCPSGKKGGSLGWFGRGQMVKEFENFRNIIFDSHQELKILEMLLLEGKRGRLPGLLKLNLAGI